MYIIVDYIPQSTMDFFSIYSMLSEELLAYQLVLYLKI